MDFLKAGLTFAMSTGTKLIAGLFIVKIIALYVGAEGLGQLGQFMSVMNMVTIIAGGGIVTGLIKYIAEYIENREQLSRYLSSGALITLTAGILFALTLIIFSNKISIILFGTPQFAAVFYILAFMQFIIGVNSFATSAINGYKDVQGYAVVSVAGIVVGTAIMFYATKGSGLRGAMYGLMLMPAVMALFSIPYVFYRRYLSFKHITLRFHNQETKRLLRYTVMLLVTVCTMPVAQIIVRNMIERNAGWSAAGYWQGVIRISDAYLQFVTVVLANYYLPQLSATNTKKELQNHVYQALRITIPITVLMAITIFLCRDGIISILFSPAFIPMRDMFLFQLIGDCFKISAYTIGYVGVAKAMTKLYIFAEIYQSFVFVLLSALFLDIAGPVGITYAYAANYAVYFVITLFVFRWYVSR